MEDFEVISGFYLDAEWGSCRGVTVDHVSIFVHQELGEVPLYAVSKKPTFARLQELV